MMTTSIVHVDSVYSAVDGSCVQIWDHRPGFPGTVVTSGCLGLDAALAAMEVHRAAGNTDIWYVKKAQMGNRALGHAGHDLRGRLRGSGVGGLR